MKKLLITYLVIPGAMFAVFFVFYLGAVKEMDIKAKQKAEAKAVADAEEAKRKAEIERKATEDAERRQKERETAEAAKEAKKEADYQAVMTQLRTEADDYGAQADKLAKEVGALEISISQARTNKEKLNRESFDLAKEVELAKISRRNAEIEIQRMVEMAGRKMADSSVAIAPPAAAPVGGQINGQPPVSPCRTLPGAAFLWARPCTGGAPVGGARRAARNLARSAPPRDITRSGSLLGMAHAFCGWSFTG